jgi:hypothetical protein
VAKAQDGVRSTDSLSSTQSVHAASAQDAFYACIADQAKGLIPQGASIWIATDPETGQGIVLLNAVVGFADIAPDPQEATVILALQPESGHGPTCDGQVVVATPGGSAR